MSRDAPLPAAAASGFVGRGAIECKEVAIARRDSNTTRPGREVWASKGVL